MNGVIALAGGVVGLISFGLLPWAPPRWLYRAVCLAALAASSFLLTSSSGISAPIAADGWTRGWQLLFVAGGAMLVLLLRAEDETPFALAVGCVLGMSLLAAAKSFLALFLGLELMSLPAYLLVYSLRRDKRSLEAATKYFFMGSTAASIFLLGLAAAFGSSGRFELAPMGGGTAALAVALMGSAALFKVGAFPFHFWIPDVYEAARPELAGFLSTSMKAAGFLLLLRLVTIAAPGSALLALLPAAAAATMILGNVMAWRQDSVARLLGYSSIAHAGYLLLGVVAWNDLGREPAGVSSIYLYLLAYLAANFGAFAVVSLAGLEKLDDLKGLSKRAPAAAALMAVFILSLAGVPPTGLFLGKLLIFWDAVLAGRIWLLVVAVLASLAGLGVYVRLVRLMYLEAPTRADSLDFPHGIGARAVLWVCAGPSMVMGLFPWMTDWARYILVK
jgi:NADH-quinone oxidoreductase subunit N